MSHRPSRADFEAARRAALECVRCTARVVHDLHAPPPPAGEIDPLLADFRNSFRAFCAALAAAWTTIPRVLDALNRVNSEPIEDAVPPGPSAHELALHFARTLWRNIVRGCSHPVVRDHLVRLERTQVVAWLKVDPDLLGEDRAAIAARVGPIPQFDPQGLEARIQAESDRGRDWFAPRAQAVRHRPARKPGPDKISEAILRLTARRKDGLPGDIPSIARDMGCSPQNLRQSRKFMREYDADNAKNNVKDIVKDKDPTLAPSGERIDPPAPTNLAELADRIRSERPRMRNVPRLLEYMVTRGKATFEELKKHVHEASVEDDALERAIVDARKAIVSAGLPIGLHVSDRCLYKDTRAQ